MSTWRNKLIKKSNKSYEDIHYSCTIRFLDDSEPLTITFQKETKGQIILDQVCKELNLLEKDYFGLRYVDADKQRHWLDPTKVVYRQLKNVQPMVLCFRVKYYPEDPMKLKEEITRYFLFLQLRRDLHHGRLLCSPADANQLAAYIIQSEVGDYDPQDHLPGYVNDFKMLPKQTTKQEEKIAELHKQLAGEVPSEAEGNFLKKSSALETYGVDPHPVKDQKGNQMYLGVTHLGIVTFQGNKRTHLFKWPQITKIAFEGKMFIVHVTISEAEESLSNKKKKHACGFKCPTFSACKHLWKCAVEQQYFFTLSSSGEAPKVTSGGGFFTRGSKFRFSGRCQRDVYKDSEDISREEPEFNRSSSNPTFMRSFNALRSASLPAKLRMQDISDVVLDGNNVHSMETSLVNSGSPGDTILEETIPEETSVKVGETPYRPIRSPSKEDLPSFPIGADHVGPMTSSPLGQGTPQSPDLDAQIEELQHELDKCRSDPDDQSSEKHVHEVPVDVRGLQNAQSPEKGHVSGEGIPGAGESYPNNTDGSATTEGAPGDGVTTVAPSTDGVPVQGTPATQRQQQQQRGLSCCRALTIAFFLIFTTMAVMAFCVLESDLQVPVISDIRQMPEIQNFKHNNYDPFKTTVAQKMGGLFK